MPSSPADTIKYLSDYNINCTVIIVGVAESLGDLVRNHESLRRLLTCIPLQRMRDDEFSELIESRLDRASLEIEGPAKLKILRLSRGLPFYVHTIAKLGCLAAARSASRRIGVAQVNAAIEQVIDELRQTFCDGVTNMLAGSRGSIFPEVVLASALADADDDGYFSAKSVAAPLSRMLRRQMKPASFQRHLADLASDERGRLLVRRGQPGSHRFRFRDALTQPYVIMDSLCRGLIDEAEALRRPGIDITAHATAPEGDWTYGSARPANMV
ncbi:MULTISPECIES: hypothetical protein [unclassified Mesorhizobium]|uniref:hypothetical protein n=1 Tax=unclassified Mesorhizobium TaxID=325217 RepID=UPI0003CEA67E|nr:hypothetical protein [Mesorhizobium sp. LSJC280B00]ESW80773.1 hypothetical protein X772_24530 [Mesorhizobium sp. LSJC280B00]